MDALNFLRELLCSILLSTLFHMLVALKVKGRWPEVVLQRGYLKRIARASKAIVNTFAKFAAEVAWS